MDNINEIINNHVKLGILAEEIDNDAPLDEYGLNSIDFIRLVIAIEMEYGFEIDNDHLLIKNLNTKTKIKNLVESMKNNGL